MLALALITLASAEIDAMKAASPETAAAVEMFISACIDGELRLSPDQFRKLQVRDLPYWNRNETKGSKHAQHLRLLKPVRGFLVTAQYDPPNEAGVVETCSVEAEVLNFRVAGTLVHHALTGELPSYNKNSLLYVTFAPETNAQITVQGHQLTAIRYDDRTFYKVRQELTGSEERTRAKMEK